MPMTEIEYHKMQETEAMGQIIAACAKAIFECWGGETMTQFQRSVFKNTECGAAVSFELYEDCLEENDNTEAPISPMPKSSSTYIFPYPSDQRAHTVTEPWLSIRRIGVSSIVEGSDVDIPLEWIDLAQYCDETKYNGNLEDLAKIAVNDFNALVERVDDAACSLWEEVNEYRIDPNA